MKKALNKDIVRTIWKEKKRFLAIMMITALGVTVMTGLTAGCTDLRMSADRFFDEQKLFDVVVQSTLGLTEEDIKVLEELDGVEIAEGAFTEIVHTKKGDINKTAEVKIVNENGLNIPYLVEGTLPEKINEIAVTKNYIAETGKKVGDVVVIEELMDTDEESDDVKNASEPDKTVDGKKEITDDKPQDKEAEADNDESADLEDLDIEMEEEETPNFLNTEFVITGVIVDVMDINNADGSAGFRATPNADYTFFVTSDAVDSEVYTAVYLALADTDALLCYSDVYEAKTAVIISEIEKQIMEQRQEARYEEVTGEAYDKIGEAEEEMFDAFAEVEEEFSEAEIEISDGWKELEDGKKELLDKEAEVAQEIADAKAEVTDGYQKLEEAKQQLLEGWQEIDGGTKKLQEGRRQLEEQEKNAKEQLNTAQKELENKAQENEKTKAALKEQLALIKPLFGEEWTKEGGLSTDWKAFVKAANTVLLPFMRQQTESGNNASGSGEEQTAQLMALLEQDADYVKARNTFLGNVTLFYMNMPPEMQGAIGDISTLQVSFVQLAMGMAQTNAMSTILTESQELLDEQRTNVEQQLQEGRKKLEEGEDELARGRSELEKARLEIEENRKKLDDAVVEIAENEEKARKEFADARAELVEGETELMDGENELEENRVKYEDKKVEAIEKIEDAKEEVAKIDMTRWYVQDRTSLSGYVNVQTDAACIESLATVFNIVFFVVAILISLTTVTRMVEEERGLIGTYKALGFHDGEIRRKYVSYALAASVFGGILGDIGGFVVLPEILFIFFDVMYMLPAYFLQFNFVTGSISVILFVIGIAGAAYVACYAELKHLPAHLMRPKSPKMGSRVFLEYITPLWKRFSFLNKVTARNLFRYKKRFFMTVFGIMGCTALLVFGFAIKDTVSELMPMQYENVYKYDLLAAVAAEDNDKLVEYMDTHTEVADYINIQVESIKLKNAKGESEKVQMMIFPDGTDIEKYFTLTDTEYVPVTLEEDGIFVTQNAAIILGLETGGTAAIQKLDLEQEEATIAGLVKNYLGNCVYVSQSAYEKIFDEYEPNGVLANLADTCENQIAFSDCLSEEDWILSSVSTEDLKEGFSAAFTLINIVVYVILVLAAGLAFVVLFTLASVNISERIRELAVIKVLGFYDREVHSYVNKETLILTGIGILLGLPLGALLSMALTGILKMPSIYFAVTIYSKSYFFSAGLALLFAFLVQIMTDRSLDVIAPAEALKSVE